MLQNSDQYTHYATLTAMLAPAFFLTATASLLLSANNRLARIIDRARSLLKELHTLDDPLQRALYEQRIALHQAGFQFVPGLLTDADFSHLPRGQTFKHAANFNRSGDFMRADRTHLKTATPERHQQPFLLQRAKGHAHRHARHAESLGGGHFHQTLSGRQLA